MMDFDATIPGRAMDALVWQVLSGHEPNLFLCRYVDGEYQPHAGYPIGHVSPEHFSTNNGKAMAVFSWMSRHGIVALSNGDGDSYDCDWLPQGTEYLKGKYRSASVRAMYGLDCESWAHAICLSLLVGVGAVTPARQEND